MLGGIDQSEEHAGLERAHLLSRPMYGSESMPDKNNNGHYSAYNDGINLSQKFERHNPQNIEERRAIARKRVQRIFKLPLTFKKPQHAAHPPGFNISLTPSSSAPVADDIKKFQTKRPPCHFLITDYNKTQIQVKCQKDFEGAERPDWSMVRWIHLDEIKDECLPVLKANLPAPILIKDITRPSYKFRVEEHERYVLIVLHLIANPEEAASASRRSFSNNSSHHTHLHRHQPGYNNNNSDDLNGKRSNEISTVKLIVYLFFEANILKFTLAPLQIIINYHSEYLETMEDKITYQHLEVASYQNIFHEIHDIRRELQHLRARLINISETIEDVREIAEREHESRAPVLAAASAFASGAHARDNSSEAHGSHAHTHANERNGIFPHRLKLASIVRLQFKHLSANVNQMAAQTTTLQEVCSWLADLVFQTLSQKMNQTMKTLTLISMIFIPLTFIVGVYGTNFEFLPELKWKYGYVFLWGLCIGVVVVELFMFKRLRWI